MYNKMKYNCEKCSYGTDRKHNINRHFARDNCLWKTYTCCGHTFSQKSHYDKHLLSNKHNGIVVERKVIQPIVKAKTKLQKYQEKLMINKGIISTIENRNIPKQGDKQVKEKQEKKIIINTNHYTTAKKDFNKAVFNNLTFMYETYIKYESIRNNFDSWINNMKSTKIIKIKKKTPIKTDKTPIKTDKTPIKTDKTPIKIQCDKCNSIVLKSYFKKHQKTDSCINALPRGIINDLE